MSGDVLDAMVDLRARNQPYAVATVVETEGSVSAKTGARAVIDAEGRIVAGWVGGGCAESTACGVALECLASGLTRVVDIDMNDEVLGVGMPCGGSMRVFVEPVPARPALWIMGHGRIAECLCLLGDLMGYRVVVNDPLATVQRYPAAVRIVTDDVDYDELQPVAGDAVVVATQHKGDHQSMTKALRCAAGYIALVASRRRSRLVMDYLREQGFDAAALARVMAPAGLDLGARTPEEIALSVMSEVVLTRRSGSGARLRDTLALDVRNEAQRRVKAVGS
jgi:xanthine dehydrogenase accessory factor